MTDKELLDVYIHLASFLSELLGPGCEVLVHDVSAPQKSVVAIYNSLSGRKVGDPMTDLAREVVETNRHEEADYMANYTGRNKKANFLSSTYYIKNGKRLIGMLCINKDLTEARAARASLDALLKQFNLDEPRSHHVENLDTPLDILHDRVAKIITESGVTAARMSRDEKRQVVLRLNEEGLLQIKGAMAEIAAQLEVSVPTVYRYLNAK